MTTRKLSTNKTLAIGGGVSLVIALVGVLLLVRTPAKAGDGKARVRAESKKSEVAGLRPMFVPDPEPEEKPAQPGVKGNLTSPECVRCGKENTDCAPLIDACSKVQG